jgi:hypothetical protein
MIGNGCTSVSGRRLRLQRVAFVIVVENRRRRRIQLRLLARPFLLPQLKGAPLRVLNAGLEVNNNAQGLAIS